MDELKEGLGEVKLYFHFHTHYFSLDMDFSIFKKLLLVLFGQVAPGNVHCLVIVCTIYKGVPPPSEWSIPLFLLKSSRSPSLLRILSLFTHGSCTSRHRCPYDTITIQIDNCPIALKATQMGPMLIQGIVW